MTSLNRSCLPDISTGFWMPAVPFQTTSAHQDAELTALKERPLDHTVFP